jgi:bacillithiol system protein YtxJ
MNWIALTDYSQIQKALEQSEPFLVFKHSTRCSISSMAKSRFERNYELESVQAFYLDLIAYREISNQLSADFGIKHQSPQLLLIQSGTCTYNASHNSIDLEEIKAML